MDKEQIFSKASTTYYNASRFFPAEIREDVYTLYAFVRTADDFVDAIPAAKSGFMNYKKEALAALSKGKSDNPIINDFVELYNRKKFKKEWVESFLAAMEADLTINTYATMKDLEGYMYGSAEVIGLFMSAIMELPVKAYPAARMQGRAMQLINFIRDIREDQELDRVYLPQADMKKFKISRVRPITEEDELKFAELVRFEIERYYEIQAKATAGYEYIPRRYRISVKTAADIYTWTAKQIYKNPMIVFEKKVKPHKLQVIAQYLINYLTV
ncbi:MAG: phytoene/squalene synthase family protein [Weeksellaceae bacterium]